MIFKVLQKTSHILNYVAENNLKFNFEQRQHEFEANSRRRILQERRGI